MSVLTTNNSEAFLQNFVEQQRNKDRQNHFTRENTPSNGSSTKEEIVLLEKQGRCSQKLRSSNAMGNLAQVSNMVKGSNTTDISNISNNTSKLPKIVLPPRKERNSSAPPSALPRPPTRTLKTPRKIEYGRLSETESNKSTETSERNKNEYDLKTSSLKRHQSPISNSSGTKNFLNIKNELQLALNGKGNTKNYGAIKNESSAQGITKIYYSNKPDYLSTKNYQRFDSSSTPPSPSSSDSMKRPFATPPTSTSSNNSAGKKISFVRASSATQNQKASSRDSLNSISSGSNSNSRSSPLQSKIEQPMIPNPLMNRSRTRTPPKYLNINQVEMNNNSKMNYSPTKLPSASVLHAAHMQQAPQLPPKPIPTNHLRGTSTGRSGSGENKYRIQF